MKKLLTFSLAFMLAVLFNTNAFAQLYHEIYPAPGEVKLNEFKEVRSTFPEVTSLTKNGTLVIGTKVNGRSGWVDKKDPDFRIEGNSLVLTITDAEVGTYGIYLR